MSLQVFKPTAAVAIVIALALAAIDVGLADRVKKCSTANAHHRRVCGDDARRSRYLTSVI